ncbi:SUMO-conjugating enzyme UBC9-B-like [Rhopilema esculentum]|uniref:SUMO-conjugating enzyme UBC9-B-like n=1 Tax=Rhopilema esculentum TaxID=499914 RepID=UPI0031D2CE09
MIRNMATAEPKIDPCERLKEEHKVWKLHHPKGFSAEPRKDENGVTNWLLWDCAIPGKSKTPWEGGLYKLKIKFSGNYPFEPPSCYFDPPILHPNVFPSGTVSLSLLDRNKGWKPQITVKQVLLGIQMLLNEPNFQQPAQAEAFALYAQSQLTYEDKIKEQACLMAAK